MEYYKRAVYRNPKWELCRNAVIERDRDICYFCGRLILKRRTIHHLIEIDEHNYSDENIAFNLDNLVECHDTCHNIFHERFGKTTIVDKDLEIDYSKRERRKK